MKLKSVFAGFLAFALAAAVVAGCANQVEPAKKVIGEVESAVTAAGADATKYIPDQVQAVTSQISDLKMKFDQKDYVGVIAAAPGVLAQAQGLAAAAAAQKTKVVEALTGEWTSLAAALPVEVAALEGRIGELAKARKLPRAWTPRHSTPPRPASPMSRRCGAGRRLPRPRATSSRP